MPRIKADYHYSYNRWAKATGRRTISKKQPWVHESDWDSYLRRPTTLPERPEMPTDRE